MELVANPVISNVMVVRHLHHRSHGIRPISKYIFLLSEQLAMIFREVVAPGCPSGSLDQRYCQDRTGLLFLLANPHF
jgi:hypothetical protein